MSRRHTPSSAASDPQLAGEIADVMQALATRSRVRILGCLVEGERTVGNLAEALQMEQSAVSHQLRLLRHLGLVVGERRGRHVAYALHDSHVADLIQQAVSHAEHRRMGLRSHTDLAEPAA